MAFRKSLALVLALIMVFSPLPMQLLAHAVSAFGEGDEGENALVMKYDDRLEVSELGMAGAPVIETRSVTSKKVGSDTPDDGVVVYADGKLIAVGVGTAKLTWGKGENAVSYEITVEPATISVLLVTGHSQAAGSKGDKKESVVCEEGQVYSTCESPKYNFILCEGDKVSTVSAKDVTGMGIGYGSAKKPAKINALTEAGDGVRALDGALAYQWTKLTGEKVWVLNAARGSTSLQTWQAGGYNYRHALELSKAALGILNNEHLAGHYNLNKIGVVNYTVANGDQFWAAEEYKRAFNSMWHGFRDELALYDLNGDGEKDTVSCIGLAPAWGYTTSANQWDSLIPEPLAFYNSRGERQPGKVLNYYMSAFEDDGVIIASTVARRWTTDADVKAYFEENPIENMYGKLENGTTHTSPTTVKDGVSADGGHYTQLGYNVQGIDIATNMYAYWYGTDALQSVRLLQENGVDEVPEEIEIPQDGSYAVVPETVPPTAKLTYKVTGDAASYENGFLCGNHMGEATLTVMDTEGNPLKTVNITVTEPKKEEYPWYVWDFSTPSLSNTSGITTDNTLSMSSTAVSGTSLEDLLKNGALDLTSSQSTLKMSKSITLDTSKAWSVELVAAAKSPTDGIGAFLSTSAALSAAKYMWVTSQGDLMLVTKASFTADDGTEVGDGYVCFKVSDEDFAKSKLSSDFDITKEHKYELRCGGGIISYWLDGEKVGDLALSEQSSSRGDDAKHYTSKQPSYNGENFNSMTMTYWGTGSSSKPYSQGLKAKVKRLAVYAGSETLDLKVILSAVQPIDPIMIRSGDRITLPAPNTGDYCAKFLYWSENYDGSGTAYKAGDVYTVTTDGSVTLYAIWDDAGGTGADHEYENGVCKYCGAKQDHAIVWTFDDGTRTSSTGGVTLTPVTTNHSGDACANGTAEVVGGVMQANRVCLEMSKALTLSEADGWYIEYSMECEADSINQTLLSVKKRYYNQSIVLLTSGNLVMLYKTTLDGINDYWVFKVADADFQAALPEGFSRTDYHTYRLECSGGTYSYWLDGKKIGDLNCTSLSGASDGDSHVQAGNKLNFSTMNVRYMGNGNSSDPTLYGLDAKIDKIVICTKYHTHTYDNACDVDCNECSEVRDAADHVYDNACDTTCGECGAERTVTHDFSVQDKDAERHWMKCSVCGTIDETTRANHVHDNACDTDCNECGEVREVPDHVYDNACDTDCNECGEVRDASAEAMGHVRTTLDNAGVLWQIATLGKVDQGGGGTVAAYMANRNIVTVDAGVPVLCMHAPMELVSKLDCYMTMLACKAIYLA